MNQYHRASTELTCNIEDIRANAYNGMTGDLIGVDCSICKNKGYIAYVDDGHEYKRECECMEVRRSMSAIKRSGLGQQIKECTFANYRTDQEWQKQAKTTAQDLISTNGKWFYFGGQSGCGKTHLCTAIVGEYLKHGKSARYMLWRDEVVKLKGNVNDEEYYTKLIGEFKNTDVLYIDDFFKTEKGKGPTTGDINVAFELINYRYNNPNQITIISTELLLDDLLNIDEATGSRIFQRTKGYCLNIDKDRNKNFRLKGE